MPTAKRFTQFNQFVLLGLRFGLPVLIGLCCIIRLSVKDRFFGPSILYYALTWLALGILSFVAAVAWGTKSSRNLTSCGVFALLGVVQLFTGWWEHQGRGAGIDEPGIDIVYWNVARPSAKRWPGVLETIKATNADIIVLGEAKKQEQISPALLKEHFPAYKFARFSTCGMTLLVRGEVLQREQARFAKRHKHFVATVLVHGRELEIHGVDLHSSPFADKKVPFDALHQRMAAHSSGKPAIVVGDFNTPWDSVQFERMKTQFRHALRAGQGGGIATWPNPLPVLAIDHIWVERDLKLLRAGRKIGLQSDHAMIFCTILPPP